jgi:hypothetical protein
VSPPALPLTGPAAASRDRLNVEETRARRRVTGRGWSAMRWPAARSGQGAGGGPRTGDASARPAVIASPRGIVDDSVHRRHSPSRPDHRKKRLHQAKALQSAPHSARSETSMIGDGDTAERLPGSAVRSDHQAGSKINFDAPARFPILRISVRASWGRGYFEDNRTPQQGAARSVSDSHASGAQRGTSPCRARARDDGERPDRAPDRRAHRPDPSTRPEAGGVVTAAVRVTCRRRAAQRDNCTWRNTLRNENAPAGTGALKVGGQRVGAL